MLSENTVNFTYFTGRISLSTSPTLLVGYDYASCHRVLSTSPSLLVGYDENAFRENGQLLLLFL